jgi:asparagine synthetase B (glutamine-hydrolysing)
MPDGRRVSLAFMEHPAVAGRDMPMWTEGDSIFARSCSGPRQGVSAADLWRQMEQAPSRNDIRIAIRLHSGELCTAVPIATPEQVFYSENARGFVLSNDMRLVTHWAGGPLSPAALFALFQYGTIPAPLSLCDGVVRVPPGHVLKNRPGRALITLTPLPGPADGSVRECAGTDSEVLLLQALDTQLGQVPEDAMLYFSGGVDSSLLASRLRRIGRSDITLVNFAFGAEDGEGRLAREIASHLRLRCEHILFDPGNVTALLERVGRDYSFPFGDDSTIPTNLLVHASIKALGPGRTILEGTGADGGFGPVVRRPDLWQRLYAVPASVRRLLGASYRWLRLWEHDPYVPKARTLASLAHKSTCMQMEIAAVLSANALDGVAYCIPPDVREELGGVLGDPLRHWGKHLSLGERLALLDLIYVCAGRFAAKSFDPLRRAGMDPVYPFLEPALLRVSFRLPWEEKTRGDEGKVLLKRLLAREIPRELVYRRKSAFDAPLSSVLARPDVQAYFHDVVLSDWNPVLDFLEVGVVRHLIELCRESKPLELSARRFLWTILFLSVWLTQVDNRLM